MRVVISNNWRRRSNARAQRSLTLDLAHRRDGEQGRTLQLLGDKFRARTDCIEQEGVLRARKVAADTGRNFSG